ncbi:TetR/AcrR family transcriptional regulator [Rhizomicrobium electricum]|jgi:AcrR family transcriptional regulator|uniref:TetR/AcrR family transcriptional regulator n=2 Tax=Rhizomicrobium electricum TaxID=480070 RepID=A0ABN1FA54_9PROT
MDSAPMRNDLPRAAAAGKREQTKVLNRQLILNAARQVFAELGYGAATVRDIIRATPLASGTFYNYFKSKEEVYQAIRDEVALAIRPRLHDERMKASTVEEFISCTFRTFFEYVADDRMNFRTIRHAADNTRVRMDTPEVIAGFEELREDIERAISKNLFPPVDPDLLMAAIVGVAFEVSERMLKTSPHDPKAAADFATALFLGGVRALPEMQHHEESGESNGELKSDAA